MSKNSYDSIMNELSEEDGAKLEEFNHNVNKLKAEKAFAELQMRQAKFLEAVRKEPKIDVSVAPQYAAEFSNNMRVTINGISIYIPIDGRTYSVPQTFADEIKRRVQKVNRKLNRFKRRGNDNNVVLVEEKSIGDVKLF